MYTDKRDPLRACTVDAGDNRIDALRRQRCDLINAVLHERIDRDQKQARRSFCMDSTPTSLKEAK